MSDGLSKQLVDSVSLTLIARLAMIAATVALPVAGWMLKRGIDTVDRVEVGVRTLEGTQSVLHLKVDNLLGQFQDHETRIRVLEKPPIVVQPVPMQPQPAPRR